MGKKKRVNPRRIPMPKSGFDREKIISEASAGNLYYGENQRRTQRNIWRFPKER